MAKVNKKSNSELFKIIFGYSNTFWKPYVLPKVFSSSDYEVINYPVIRGAWLQRQAMLLSGQVVLHGEDLPGFEIVKNYLEHYDDDFVNLLSFIQEVVLWGMVAIEIVWDPETLYPKSYIPIPRYFISIQNDEIYINNTALKTIAPQKIILARNTATADQPYGFALISILKPLYEIVKEIYEYWGAYIRTFAMPTLIFEIDTSKLGGLTPEEMGKVRAEIEKLKNLSAIKNLVISKDWVEYSTIEPKSTNTDAFQKLLENIHTQMIIAILGQELTTQAMTSSYALGKIHYEVLKHLIKRDAKIIENTINSQLIPSLLELHNIQTQEYPYITIEFPERLSIDDIVKLAQITPLSLEDIKKLTGINL